MKAKHRSEIRKPGGRSASPPERLAAARSDAPVRFYAEAVYALNRGLPHTVDFPGRLS